MALRELSRDKQIRALPGLKCYARITHFIIESYEMLGDEACRDRYHRELKQATLTHIRLQKRDDETVADNISGMCWECSSP